MQFGDKLRLLRQRRGMTINELAQLTGYATHSRISQFETGKRKPTLEFVYKVAEVFGVSFDLLLNGELELDNEPPDDEKESTSWKRTLFYRLAPIWDVRNDRSIGISIASVFFPILQGLYLHF